MDIESALKNHEAHILRLPNVTGVGISERNGKEVIVVFVTQKIPESQLATADIIPKQLDGYETDVQVSINVW